MDSILDPTGENKVTGLGHSYFFDSTHKLILYNGDPFGLESEIDMGGDLLAIETSDTSLEIGKGYPVLRNGEQWVLYRTELPIIVLNTSGREIVDEPKIGGVVTVLADRDMPFESNMGVEIRGGSTKYAPKKSYSLELWKDVAGDDKDSEALLGMRKDDDWVLDGLWNEPLRLRDFVSHGLWLKIGRYPYSAQENIVPGIQRVFCELFVNGLYKGVYYLGEKVDRKQLALKKFDGQLQGELYKGYAWANGVTFDGVDDFFNEEDTWSGYEAKFPDTPGELDWTNLHALVDFVVTSDPSSFNATIFEKVDLHNLVDYYIFVNTIYASDNTGKNVYTARYAPDSPYFFVPWDMDGSFGTDWTGERTDITDALLTNGLYDRLLSNQEFIAELKARWQQLRSNTLQTGALQEMFNENYAHLKGNGVYEREAIDPDLPQNYSEGEIGFINSWIDRRMAFLDSHFDSL